MPSAIKIKQGETETFDAPVSFFEVHQGSVLAVFPEGHTRRGSQGGKIEAEDTAAVMIRAIKPSRVKVTFTDEVQAAEKARAVEAEKAAERGEPEGFVPPDPEADPAVEAENEAENEAKVAETPTAEDAEAKDDDGPVPAPETPVEPSNERDQGEETFEQKIRRAFGIGG